MTDVAHADTNPFILDMKRQHLTNVVGIGDSPESLKLYMDGIEEFSAEVYENPKVLDKFHLSLKLKFKSVKHIPKKRAELTRREKYMYWRANPWLAAWDVIGEKALHQTTAAGRKPIKEFSETQKQFMRDFCDPRFHKLATRRCRGGSKTCDIAVCVAIMEFLVPRLRITINSGSQEQSDNLYSYFKTFMDHSPTFEKLIKGKPLKKLTNFLHGGWVAALTASPKSVKGKRPDIEIFDEVCEIIEQLIMDALGGTWTATELKIVMAGTPDKMNHYFYTIQKGVKEVTTDTFDKGRKISSAGYYVYHTTAMQCPWISPEAIEEAKQSLSQNDFKIQMLGEFGSGTGTVFDHDDIEASKVYEYNIDNVLDSLIDKSMGVDWGFAHKTCVVVCGKDDNDILHVVYSKGSSKLREKIWTENIIPLAAEKYDPSTVGADAAGAFQNAALNEELAEHGMSVRRWAFHKYKQKMISALNARFEHRTIRLYVGLEDNDELIEQLFGYEYQKTLDGVVSDKAIKINDDYVDAMLISAFPLRTGLTGLPKPGEMDEMPELHEVFGSGTGKDYWS
jgi:hypothetical protein